MKTTLLLADTDLSARLALAHFLENEGFTVLLAERSDDILDLIRSCDVGLVVLDTQLQDQSGWEVFARVATLNPLVPAIVTTSELGQEPQAAEAGVDALVEKPVESAVLLRLIRELLTQPTEMRLQRVCTLGAFSRYVPRSYWPFVHALQERYAAPLATPELDRVLARCARPTPPQTELTPPSFRTEAVPDVEPV